MKPSSTQMRTNLRMLMGFFCLLIFVNGSGINAATKVRVAHWGHEKILIYAPLYIAMDAGFFEREGLDVQLVYSGNDDQVFATVISGAAQFGVGDPAFTAISREKGGEGKVVAALVGRVANWAVAKNPAIQPFTDPEKLNGSRVTSFPSPSTTFTILSSIKKDLNLTGMKIEQVAFGTEQAALERGDADLAIMLEPQTSIAVSQGDHVVWSLAKYYGDFALTGVTTTDSFIAEDPDTVQHFVNAIQSALTLCAKDPEAAAVILEKSFPTLQPAIVQDAMKRMVADETIPKTAVIEKAAWLKTLRLRQAVGDLKSLSVADSCLDTSFAESAANGDHPQRFQPRPAPKAETGAWYWIWFGRLADLITLLTFALVFVTLKEHRKAHVAWNSLDQDEQTWGRLIAECFQNPEDTSERQFIIEVLTEKHGISKQSAEKVIQKYTDIGLIEKIKGGDKYRPVVTQFAKLVPLFLLCR